MDAVRGRSSDVQGPAWLKSPGLARLGGAEGSDKLEAGPLLTAQAGLGQGSGLSQGFRAKCEQKRP